MTCSEVANPKFVRYGYTNYSSFIGRDPQKFYECVSVYNKEGYPLEQFFVELYHVSFYNGTELLKTESVVSGGSVEYSGVIPVREGYRFDGWDKSLENISQDLHVQAQFIKTWNVTFMDGENIISEQIVDHGSSAVVPENTQKEGYRFIGWDQEFNNVTKDLVIKAKYVKTWTVTFLDGDKVLDVQTIDDSSVTTEPEVPQKTGYRFIDWDTDFNNVQQDLEVHAQFIKTWNVVFKNGDTIISEQTVDDGKAAVEPAIPVKEGYSFVGWDCQFNSITNNTVITAQFEQKSGCQSSMNEFCLGVAVSILFLPTFILVIKNKKVCK